MNIPQPLSETDFPKFSDRDIALSGGGFFRNPRGGFGRRAYDYREGRDNRKPVHGGKADEDSDKRLYCSLFCGWRRLFYRPVRRNLQRQLCWTY